jgi:hypothetical protein
MTKHSRYKCIAGKWGLTEEQSAANRYCTSFQLDGILFGS